MCKFFIVIEDRNCILDGKDEYDGFCKKHSKCVLNLLMNIVKEEGVVNMILDLTQQMEWVDLINQHDGDWKKISKQKLSLEFIRAYQNEVNWDSIIIKKLPEEFIREFQNRINNWGMLSHKQKLSEEFIRDFQDKVDFDNIFFKQSPLSHGFFHEFIDRTSPKYKKIFQDKQNKLDQ